MSFLFGYISILVAHHHLEAKFSSETLDFNKRTDLSRKHQCLWQCESWQRLSALLSVMATCS